MSKKARGIDSAQLRSAMVRRAVRRSKASGSLTFPAVPALVDSYVETLDRVFSALGRPFHKNELARARDLLVEKIDWAYARSQNSWVVVDYQTDPEPKMSLTYTVTGWHTSVAERYAEWIATRTPPLFGTHPDARLMDLARTLGKPGEVTCLDVGAGTGRNALPLARAGHPVDALEPATKLADALEAAVAEAGVGVRVLREGFLEASSLRAEGYRLVVLAQTSTHWRGIGDLQLVCVRLANVLAPGGVGLMNVFLAKPNYTPDALARQLSQILWCPIFTRQELERTCASLPLELVDDEPAREYERAHLPPEAWPPTSWFDDWAGGRDLFDLPEGKPPFELRWVTCRRRGS